MKHVQNIRFITYHIIIRSNWWMLTCIKCKGSGPGPPVIEHQAHYPADEPSAILHSLLLSQSETHTEKQDDISSQINETNMLVKPLRQYENIRQKKQTTVDVKINMWCLT